MKQTHETISEFAKRMNIQDVRAMVERGKISFNDARANIGLPPVGQ